MVFANIQRPRPPKTTEITAPLRSLSLVLRQYPWRHGFIAHAGPILPWVVEHRPSGLQPCISRLIDSIARSVDTFDSATFPRHTSSDFVRSIWFPADNSNRTWNQSGAHLSLLGSVMLLYSTLDTLLWVYGWEKYPTIYLQRPRTAFPTNLSDKFEKVIRLVDDWASLIDKIPFPCIDSRNTTRVHNAGPRGEYDAALDRFCKAVTFEKEASWGQVCAHIHKVGFVFQWLPYHHNSTDVYREEASGTAPLINDADARGLQLGETMGTECVRKMLNVAHAALGITPIILLSPRKCLNNIGSKEMLFYFSNAIGSKPAVFDELEKCLWKIVVEGPEDIQGRLRSLQALYRGSLQEANHCRAYFLQPPSTDGADDDQIDPDSPNRERSMGAGNSARTRDSAPLASFARTQQVPVNNDGLEVAEHLQEDARPPSDTAPRAPVACTQQVPVSNDEVEVAEHLQEDAGPPSDTGGDAAMDAIDTPIAETSGHTNTPRDSLPTIAVQEAVIDTDSEIAIDDTETPPNPRRPRSIKLIVKAKSRQNATPATRTTASKGYKRRRVDDHQHTDVGAMPESWRDVPDVAGVPEPANDLQSDPVPLAAETVDILMHGPKPGDLPEQHRFRTSATVASLENKLLAEIYASVRAHYHHGTPLHHLPSASNPDLNDAADRATRSSIFVVPHTDFEKMDPLKVQQIFRQRHILVYDAPNRPEEFSERNIAALGGYGRLRNVQDISFRTADAADRCGRGGTLQQFWEESQKPDNGRILNILDIPMRMRDGRHMPGYKSLASHEAAFAETDGKPGYVMKEPPFSNFVWALASMANATSWNHMDAAGVATVIDVESGAKWWAVADCPSDPSAAGCAGDLSSIHGLGDGWETVSSGHGRFRHEAVLLKAGMWLFMRPCTVHYVLTVRNSVTHGRHFYAAGTVRSSCWGIIHCSVMGSGITNNEHPQTIQLLRRMLHVTFDSFRERSSSPYGAEHRIDPTTPEGLLDVVALGNTIELIRYLDARFYSGVIDRAESAELDFITAQYHEFQRTFSDRYAMVIDNKRVNVIESLFKPSMLRLAVSIVAYRRSMKSFEAGYTAASLRREIKGHLSRIHPDLVEQYDRDVEARRRPDYLKSLDWTGPAFSLESKEVEM